MRDLGDFAPSAIVDFKFNTYSLAGAPITLAGSPALAVYKDNGTTEITAGVTLTVDFDSRTGMHNVRLDLSNASYTTGSAYQVVLTAGTVDSVSVVGTVIAGFTMGQLAASGVATSAVMATIKAKTDQMNFTVAGQLDGNSLSWGGSAVAAAFVRANLLQVNSQGIGSSKPYNTAT